MPASCTVSGLPAMTKRSSISCFHMTIHRERAYRDDYPDVALPVTEDVSDRSVILPLFVGMTDDEVAHVVGTLRASLAP